MLSKKGVESSLQQRSKAANETRVKGRIDAAARVGGDVKRPKFYQRIMH